MELKIEYIAVENLKPYEKNNKKHEDFDPGLQETCVNAINFINRQKAEIESWQGGYMTQKQEIANLETELKAMRGAANSYKAEIERLNSRKEVVVPSMRLIDENPLNGFNLESHRFVARTVEDVKAEAYKDFAEEVNKELFGEEYQLDKAHQRAVQRVLNRLINKE